MHLCNLMACGVADDSGEQHMVLEESRCCLSASSIALGVVNSSFSTTILDAETALDGSVALSQKLLAKLDTLPGDARAVGHLLKQGHLPVPHGNLEALEDMTKELVVGSSGKLAKFFSNKIRNGGLLDATGKLLFLAAHKANALVTSQSRSADHCFC